MLNYYLKNQLALDLVHEECIFIQEVFIIKWFKLKNKRGMSSLKIVRKWGSEHIWDWHPVGRVGSRKMHITLIYAIYKFNKWFLCVLFCKLLLKTKLTLYKMQSWSRPCMALVFHPNPWLTKPPHALLYLCCISWSYYDVLCGGAG